MIEKYKYYPELKIGFKLCDLNYIEINYDNKDYTNDNHFIVCLFLINAKYEVIFNMEDKYKIINLISSIYGIYNIEGSNIYYNPLNLKTVYRLSGNNSGFVIPIIFLTFDNCNLHYHDSSKVCVTHDKNEDNIISKIYDIYKNRCKDENICIKLKFYNDIEFICDPDKILYVEYWRDKGERTIVRIGINSHHHIEYSRYDEGFILCSESLYYNDKYDISINIRNVFDVSILENEGEYLCSINFLPLRYKRSKIINIGDELAYNGKIKANKIMKELNEFIRSKDENN